jgi:effector-binding domain-containing protein
VQPQILDRPDQPYVAIRARVTMDTISAIADRFPELMAWLAEHQLAAAGAPFLKYNLIDMDGLLEVEAAAPVSTLPDTAGSDAIVGGTLPSGRYACLTHVGPFDGLVAATKQLLDWAHEQQLSFDTTDTPTGERWGGRLEIYYSDPRQEQDPAKWTTELAFRLAD